MLPTLARDEPRVQISIHRAGMPVTKRTAGAAAPPDLRGAIWLDGPRPSFPPLEHDLATGVAVVGGGMTGLMTAYYLAREGRSVAILERDRWGHGDTGHTSAHLTMVTDDRLSTLARRFGDSHAQAVWDAGLAAIAELEATVHRHRMECDFARVDGYLHAPTDGGGPDQRRELAEEAELARALGFDAELVDEAPMTGTVGIRFPSQARFHSGAYLAALVSELTAMGVEVYEHSTAQEFSPEPLELTVNGHRVRCSEVVLATHNPLVGVAPMARATILQSKLALYTSYVVAARAPRGLVPDALFWDTDDPYRYLRVQPGDLEDVIVFGGEDHKTGQVSQTGRRHERLERWLVERFPGTSPAARWSGQVIQTPDGLPYIGRTADHQFVATGFNGNGLTLGTLAAMIISDAIIGRANPWTDLFEPDRSVLRRGLWDYVKENADYPYYLVRDLFAGADGRSLREVSPGEGKVVSYRGKRVAAYRDARGTLEVRSVTCPHLGCQVAWNDAERTWDCPCHGSRFGTDGAVLAGPAEAPLAPFTD
jgi:glycine/D-amino acid oxidase-like deaminating enzyme/nitrite reductase/ring-hydroxylating ferredoxin subunit